MSVEGVFVPGVSGMGPALSKKGERIVNAKMGARDRMLDDLEKRGLNVEALAHRHRSECEPCAANEPNDLEEARARIRAQEARIAHLEHRIAVQENQILLLREALAPEE